MAVEKDRQTLSPHLREVLLSWWMISRSRGWLFPGQDPIKHMTARNLNRYCHAAKTAAQINKRVSPRTLRHSFATHCSSRVLISVSYRRCSKQRHTAHEQPIEGRIYYPFHPRCGETVLIIRRFGYRGVELVVIPQPDGSQA